jgi:hypothetical protein
LTSNEGQITKLVKNSLEKSDASLPENPLIVEPISFFRGTAQSTDLIAVVSGARLIAELELKQLRELPLNLEDTRHVVGIIERNDPYRSTFSKELISLIQTCAEELGLPVRTPKTLPTVDKS